MRPINAGFRLATRIILICILGGMLAYLGLFAYFMIGRSWALPVILTPGHERVITAQRDYLDRTLRLAEIRDRLGALKRQAAELDAGRDAAKVIKASVDASIESEARMIAVEKRANAGARDILSRESEGARAMLADLRREARPAADLKAGLIDRTRFLAELLLQVNLSLNVSNLTVSLSQLDVQKATLEKRARNLAEVEAAKSSADAKPGFEEAAKVDLLYKARVSLDLYEAERERNRAAFESLSKLESDLAAATETLGRSPLIAAAGKPTVVVFVPYENLSGFEASKSVVRCRFWLVACREAGKLTALADGEVILPHPLFGRQVRGALYAVEAKSTKFAQDALLFSSPPLFL